MNKAQQRYWNRHAQIGQTVIGALLALVIFGALIFYATSKYVEAQRDSNADSAVSDVQTLLHNSDTTYSSLPSCGGGLTTNCGYWNVSARSLITAGDVPASMVAPGANALTSRFGTPVNVSPSFVLNQNDAIQLQFEVPASECARFATGIASDVDVVNVGGTQVQNIVAGSGLNLASLGQRCNAGAGAVTIQLVHML